MHKVLYENNHSGRNLAMRFQARDGAILQAIHEYDGVLARRHIKYLFWHQKSWRALERRLSKLRQHEYIAWPDMQQRKSRPIPEPIVWLGWRGALFLAGQSGIQTEPPKRINENQLRSFERRLRAHGFNWLREPRWIQLSHDLGMVDIRLSVERSIQEIPNLSLEKWINERVFRADMDFIEFNVRRYDGQIIRKRKGVCPDGMFILVDKKRRESGKPFRARFLIELDMATHDNPSFGRDKAIPGAAYIHSVEYRKRFGSNAGRWLVITTSEVRMKNLMRQTLERIQEDSDLFLFSTFEKSMEHNTFKTPIWTKCKETELSYLISE